MIPRVRMARKRLAIANERYISASCAEVDRLYCNQKPYLPAYKRAERRWVNYLTISRRKDHIA